MAAIRIGLTESVMKIRKLTPKLYANVSALLLQAFFDSKVEKQLVEKLHVAEKPLHEWVCLIGKKVVAYIAFSNAYHNDRICGLHLAPLAVAPAMQNQGIGSELMRFALRQPELQKKTIYVLGSPDFYRRFGFELCQQPICPFDENNAHFLAIRNRVTESFTIGYEAEFMNGFD